MNYFFSLNSPLQSIFWRNQEFLYKKLLLILSGVILLAVASQLSIPLTPVPITFQSATVILIGMAYGIRYGCLVIATYLALGALGLPIFADYSGGIIKFFGPTGGYLIGFLPAAAVSGFLAQSGWGKNSLQSFVSALVGVSIIFLFGVSFLATFVGWHAAFEFGVMPFVLSELIKLIAVALIIPRLWRNKKPYAN